MFSQRNPARTALLTAHWDPPESLQEALAPYECSYHYGQALDIVRVNADGRVEVIPGMEDLSPLNLYQLDQVLPDFLKGPSS